MCFDAASALHLASSSESAQMKKLDVTTYLISKPIRFQVGISDPTFMRNFGLRFCRPSFRPIFPWLIEEHSQEGRAFVFVFFHLLPFV